MQTALGFSNSFQFRYKVARKFPFLESCVWICLHVQGLKISRIQYYFRNQRKQKGNPPIPAIY